MNTRQNAHRFHTAHAEDDRGLPWHVMPVLAVAAVLAALFGGTADGTSAAASPAAQAMHEPVVAAPAASPQPGEGEAELLVEHQTQSY